LTWRYCARVPGQTSGQEVYPKKHDDDVASLVVQPVLVAVLVVEDEIGSLPRGIKSRPIVGAGAIKAIIGIGF